MVWFVNTQLGDDMGDTQRIHPDEPKQFGKRVFNQDDIDRRNRRSKLAGRLAWLFVICAIISLIVMVYPK